jgi:hypothetical protein
VGWDDLVLLTYDLLGIVAEAMLRWNQYLGRYKEKGSRDVDFGQGWRI